MLIILPMLVPIIIDNWGLHVLLRALVESSRDSIFQQAQYESTRLLLKS